MGIHIAVIEPGRDPYLKEVEPEDREGLESSYLGAFQREVGGNVEATKLLKSDLCTEHIKVNLPDSKDSYTTGNGEGVWVLVDEQVKAAYDQDAEGCFCFGILDNDSCYWPGLNHGAAIPFEMRGKNRPVVPYEWLYDGSERSEGRSYGNGQR